MAFLDLQGDKIPVDNITAYDRRRLFRVRNKDRAFFQLERLIRLAVAGTERFIAQSLALRARQNVEADTAKARLDVEVTISNTRTKPKTESRISIRWNRDSDRATLRKPFRFVVH